MCFRLSGSDLPGEEWLWSFEKHGQRHSMIRRVKRFLSAHEHPASPRRRSYGRQASDSSMFFPPSGDVSPARDLLDVPSRSPHRASPAQRQPCSPEGNPKAYSSLGELSTIRETSRTSTLQSLTPQSSVRVSPTKMPQVPEVLITVTEAPVPTSHDSTASIQSAEFTGVEPSGTGQQEVPVGLIAFPSEKGTPPRDPSPQTSSAKDERNILTLASGEDPNDNDKFPKRWSLPGFLASSHASLTGLSPDPISSEPVLSLDTETSSETSGINIVAGSRASPDVLYLLENLDTKETDIVDFNNEQAEASANGIPERSRTWF